MSRTWKKAVLAQREPRPDPKGGHVNLLREAEEDFENLDILLEDAFDDDLLEEDCK
jgi:hypothetical protein